MGVLLTALGVSSAFTTGLAGVNPELLLIIPVALGVAIIPFVARIGWRLVKAFR
jgi:hypothetical protein